MALTVITIMNTKKRVLSLAFATSLSCALYIGLAYSRVDDVALGASRDWPFPDQWIIRWERSLDEAHVVPLDVVKIEGEFPRIESHLMLATNLFSLISIVLFICAWNPQREKWLE